MNSIGPYVCRATVAAGGNPGPAPAEVAPKEKPKARRALWPFGAKTDDEAELVVVLTGPQTRRKARGRTQGD